VQHDIALRVAVPESNGVSSGDYISDPTFGLDSAESGFELDPDDDGPANGLEAWLGTRLGVFNVWGLRSFTNNGNIATSTDPQNQNPPSDLNGYYEWSPNLVDWSGGDGIDGPVGGPTFPTAPEDTRGMPTVTASKWAD